MSRSNMLRLSLMTLLATTTLSVTACTDVPVDDELADETAADGEEGKGDAAAAFTYYNVLPDNRACSFNSPGDCGRGFFVSRANRSTTQCGRGPAQSHCKVFEIDWSGTAMPDSVAARYEQGLHDGEPLLIRGDLVPAADDRGVTLAAREVWIASSPEWVDGVFTLVKDNGIRCVRAPCPSLTERKLNSNLSANISSLDLEESGAENDVLERGHNARYSPDGLIVVGYRYTDRAGGKGRTANKFFTRAPVPQF
ncbi:MAG: DUF6748 domain-containing protein [Kofleriaceae bacterium]